VTVVEAACAEEDGGEISFFVASTDGNASAVGSGHTIVGVEAITKEAPALQVREVRVQRVSLDGLCRRIGIAPAVIKIDVEGAELLVLKGGQDVLGRVRPQVRVGFHPFAFDDARVASDEFMSLAARAGYQVDGIKPGQTLELAEYRLLPMGADPSRS
jgi:FkbM family methyltransferase